MEPIRKWELRRVREREGALCKNEMENPGLVLLELELNLYDHIDLFIDIMFCFSHPHDQQTFRLKG